MEEDMTQLIGLAGKAGAGKDYIFEDLKRCFSHPAETGAVQRVAFADEVKFDLQDAFFNGEAPEVLWAKPYSPEVRWLLQNWGTEYRRAQDPDYWINRGRETIEVLIDDRVPLVVVTDVRFQNEVDVIHSLGGLVFEVIAENATRANRLDISIALQQEQDKHASAIIDFETDGHIMNDGLTTYPTALVEYLTSWPE